MKNLLLILSVAAAFMVCLGGVHLLIISTFELSGWKSWWAAFIALCWVSNLCADDVELSKRELKSIKIAVKQGETDE